MSPMGHRTIPIYLCDRLNEMSSHLFKLIRHKHSIQPNISNCGEINTTGHCTHKFKNILLTDHNHTLSGGKLRQDRNHK